MSEGNSAELYVTVVCPTCRARLSPRRELIGKRVRCPDCGVPVRVSEQATKSAHFAGESTAASEYRLSETDQPGEQPKTVLTTCGTCGARLYPRVELVGKRVKCPDCFKPVLVRPPPKEYAVKQQRPAVEYRLNAEPAPNPLAQFISTEPIEDPLFESEPPPPPPRRWYFSGVFSFPWYPGTLGRWCTLTLFFLVANPLATVLLVSLPTLSGDHNVGSAIMVPFMLALCGIVWSLTMAVACGCVVAVIRDTASGNDEVADWSDAEIYEGLWRIPYIVFPWIVAGALAYGLYFVLTAAWPGDASRIEPWARLLGTIVVFAVYPMMVLAALEQGGWWLVYSPDVMRLIFGFLGGWLLVNFAAAVLIGACAGLTLLGVKWSPYATAFVGAPLLAAVILIVARMYGRFLYRANEVVAVKAKDRAHDADQGDDVADVAAS